MKKIDELNKRIKALGELIDNANKKREELIYLVRDINRDFNEGRISKSEYDNKLNEVLRQKSYEEWIDYYNDYIADCKNKIIQCRQLINEERISEENSFGKKETTASVLKVLVMIVFIGVIVALVYNFGPAVYDSWNHKAVKTPGSEITSGGKAIPEAKPSTKQTPVNNVPAERTTPKENVPEETIPKETISPIVPESEFASYKPVSIVSRNPKAEFNEASVQGSAAVGENVKWESNIEMKSPESFSVNIPDGAKVISVKDERGNEIKSLDNLEGGKDYIIEFETPAPKISKEVFDENKERVVVSSDVHYKEVLSSIKVSEGLDLKESDKNKVRMYQIVSEEGGENRIPTNFILYDTNEDGTIDRMEWVTPHLSEAVFEIVIINITKAEHLDVNRKFIVDIYDLVKTKDGVWSGRVGNGEFVRVNFEQNLTNKNDITIYARGSEGSTAEIEVYVKDSETLIAKFENVSSENTYKILLTSLGEGENYESFDLKIIGNVEFDYIVDPSGTVNFVSPPTPADGVPLTQRNFQIEASIGNTDLKNVRFFWKKGESSTQGYSFYNPNLLLMHNFDKITAIGENDGLIKDLSTYTRTDSTTGASPANPTWTSSGKYGGGYYFDGSNDYILLPSMGTFSSGGLGVVGNPFTIQAWVKTPATIPTTDQYIISPLVYDNDFAAGLRLSGGKFSAFVAKVGVSISDAKSDIVLQPNTWYFLTGIFNECTNCCPCSKTFRLYTFNPVTGEADRKTGDYSNLVATDNSKQWVIGGLSYNGGGSDYFQGTVDELRIWNKILDIYEINKTYYTNLKKTNVGIWDLLIDQRNLDGSDLGYDTYNYNAETEDNLGNIIKAQATDRVVYISTDTTFPTVTITAPPSYIKTGSTFFSASVSDDMGLSGLCKLFFCDKSNINDPAISCFITHDVMTYTPIDTTHGTCTATRIITVPDGQYYAHIYAFDSVNHMTGAVKPVFVDSVAPIVTITSPTDGHISSVSTIDVGVTTNEAADCRASDNEGDETYDQMSDDLTCTSYPGNQFTCSFSGLSQGAHNFYVACKDTAGNKNDGTNNDQILNIIVDTTPPVINTVTFNPTTVKSGSQISITSDPADIDPETITTCVAYLSTDQTWDAGDTSLGSLSSECDGVGINIPAKPDGLYYIIVKAANQALLTTTKSSVTQLVISNIGPPSLYRFAIQDSTGKNVASIDDKGDMYLSKTASQSQSTLSPPTSSFVIYNSVGTAVAYFDKVGNLFMKGAITSNSDMSGGSSKFGIRDKLDNLVAFFDAAGNLKLKGGYIENYANP